jgi:hypothetical protein
MGLLGLFSDGELAEIVAFENADTIPAPAPDFEPESAPAVDADEWDDGWLPAGAR